MPWGSLSHDQLAFLPWCPLEPGSMICFVWLNPIPHRRRSSFESISSWRTHCLSLSHSIHYLTLLENCDLFPNCIYVNHHLIFFPFHLKALTVSKLYFLSMKVLKPHSFLIYILCTFFSAFFHSLLPNSLSSYCQEKENIWLMIFLVLKLKRVQVTRYHQQFKNFVFCLPRPLSNPFVWLTS